MVLYGIIWNWAIFQVPVTVAMATFLPRRAAHCGGETTLDAEQ